MTTNVLYRVKNWSRVLFYSFDGIKGHEVEGFKFYNDNGILLEIDRGYFEIEKTKVSQVGTTYTSKEDMENIKLTQLRNARVEKFDKKDNFVIKGVVYIYCGKGGDFEHVGTIQTQQNMCKENIHHYNNYYMSYKGEGLIIPTFSHSEKTDFGNKVDNIYKALQEKNITLDTYKIKQLLELNLLNLNELL